VRRAERTRLELIQVVVSRSRARELAYSATIRNAGAAVASDVVVQLSSGGTALVCSQPLTIEPGQELTTVLPAASLGNLPALVGIDVAGVPMLRAKAPLAS